MDRLKILTTIIFLCNSFSSTTVLTWNSSIHENCLKFDGCLTTEDRHLYLNETSKSIPCGFMAPSDLDKVRDFFRKDKICELVIYSVEMQAYDVVYNPIYWHNYLKDRRDICFVLFVDKETLFNGYSLHYISPKSKNPSTKSKNSALLGGTWKVILINKMPFASPSHTMKAIKLSGPMLFPNAKWLIWYDAKYILKRNPVNLLSDIRQILPPRTHIAVTRRFYGKLIDQFDSASYRLSFMHQSYKQNKHLQIELNEIEKQKEFYTKEGLFERTKDRDDLQIDSAIMIYKNSDVSKRYFCAWANEVGMFSRRDQLSEYMVRESLGTSLSIMSQFNKSWYFQSIGHIKPNGTDILYNMSFLPPLAYSLHPASGDIHGVVV